MNEFVEECTEIMNEHAQRNVMYLMGQLFDAGELDITYIFQVGMSASMTALEEIGQTYGSEAVLEFVKNAREIGKSAGENDAD